MNRSRFSKRCLHCGLEYTHEGDCGWTCPKCKANGHRSHGRDCDVCRRENSAAAPLDAAGNPVAEGAWYFAYDLDVFAGAGKFACWHGEWIFFINGVQYPPAPFTYKPAGNNPQPREDRCDTTS